MNIGVTGHQMRDGIDWSWVRRETRRVVARAAPRGALWSSLATGADTIAAEEALAAGLELKVVVPHEHYDAVFAPADRETYRTLLGRSAETRFIARRSDREQAYLEAGLLVAELSDVLLVVWDGRAAAGKGGTGDIAQHARTLRADVVWLDTTTSTVRRY